MSKLDEFSKNEDSLTKETQQPTTVENQETTESLSENVRILKEAFPTIDTDVIDAVLQSQNDSVDKTFELLLGMSDPQYQPTPPPMPPRPRADPAPYAYWQQHEGATIDASQNDQFHRDEEYARQLALEDQRRAKQRQSQQRREQDEDDSIFSFQDELPIIKEKVKEAGNAAKKKMLDFYNQLKSSRNDNQTGSNSNAASSSIPATNAQYKGLSDDGDDLLSGDVSALHLSDYDVYTKTNTMFKLNNNEKGKSSLYTNTVQANSPSGNPNTHTSTSDEQLKADEDFARQLAEEDKLATRESERSEPQTPQMPPRNQEIPSDTSKSSPMDDSDYEDIGLNAAPTKIDKPHEVPYVIGDDDDSDEEDFQSKSKKSTKESEEKPVDKNTNTVVDH